MNFSLNFLHNKVRLSHQTIYNKQDSPSSMTQHTHTGHELETEGFETENRYPETWEIKISRERKRTLLDKRLPRGVARRVPRGEETTWGEETQVPRRCRPID